MILIDLCRQKLRSKSGVPLCWRTRRHVRLLPRDVTIINTTGIWHTWRDELTRRVACRGGPSGTKDVPLSLSEPRARGCRLALVAVVPPLERAALPAGGRVDEHINERRGPRVPHARERLAELSLELARRARPEGVQAKSRRDGVVTHALCAAESGRSRIGRERCRVAGRRAAVGALTGERRRQKVRQPTNVTHSRSAIGSVV